MPLVLTLRTAVGAAGPQSSPLRFDSGNVVVGRAPGVDVMLPDPMVSGRHCVLAGQGMSWQIHDTSTNGTLLNGQRVAGTPTLRTGDVIGIAGIEIAVTIADGAATPAQDAWARASASASSSAPAAPSTVDGAAQLLFQGAGIPRTAVQAPDAQVLATAGILLKASLGGLIAMAQARRKARQELRVPSDGKSDNPLLTAASPDAALAELLAAPPATAARMVAELIGELDAHQRATLGAMQGSFKAALDQFSPAAIKQSARDDASAWKAYEKAFDANDGFVDVFARTLGETYGQLSRR